MKCNECDKQLGNHVELPICGECATGENLAKILGHNPWLCAVCDEPLGNGDVIRFDSPSYCIDCY